MSGPRICLSRSEFAAAPYLVWNAFVDIVALNEYRDLAPEQRPAHLVFWYDAEVGNGGHLQFFLNRGVEQVPETIAALRRFGAEAHAAILAEANATWVAEGIEEPEHVEDYVAIALEGPFDGFDAAFHAATPSLHDVLKRHLEASRDLYVILD